MKRTIPLIVLIGTAGLLVPVLGVSGESPARPACNAQWAAGCSDRPNAESYAQACGAKPSSDSGNVIDELTAILKETKSAETFVVTAMVLGRMGPEAKQAIPIIIRNAERLELFEDVHSPRSLDNNQNLATQKIIAALEMILPYPSPYAPSAYAPYGYTAPVATWNAPAGTPVPLPAAQPVKSAPASGAPQGVWP
jgi:hypothetical protein